MENLRNVYVKTRKGQLKNELEFMGMESKREGKKLTWFGHIKRRNKDWIAKEIHEGRVKVLTGRGRQSYG